MATSSSPKRSRKFASTSKGLGAAPKPTPKPASLRHAAQACLEQAGLPVALPHALFDRAGSLEFANARMAELLGLAAPWAAPLPADELEGRWPFFNEEMSSIALFRRLLGAPGGRPLMVETGLKTYKLYKLPAPGARCLVAAELVRRGDLLGDATAKRALFRSLSHEIRSSVLALGGYLDMLGPASERERAIRERMAFALKRLDGVVRRLDELRAGLEVDL